MKNTLRILGFNMLAIVIILAIFEGFFYLMSHNISLLRAAPRSIQNMVRYLYAQERPTIQFVSGCARYDKTLGYTLKPGTCSFSGREFKNTYKINRQGLRDSDAALNNPEVVVLGDSFAMGWGVEQEEAFPHRLAALTGKPVLNAAISSYGTVREMRLLQDIPSRRLRTVIIQYCGNDAEENRSFYENNNALKVMSEQDYARYAALHEASRQYYPGKYLWLKLKKRLDEMKQRKAAVAGTKDEADLFLNAVMAGGADLDNVQLIVFVLNGRNADDNRAFPKALKEKIITGIYPRYITKMKVLDFSDLLGKDHFYVLDDHLNATGHERLAQALAQYL